ACQPSGDSLCLKRVAEASNHKDEPGKVDEGAKNSDLGCNCNERILEAVQASPARMIVVRVITPNV
ncbi:MAG: hypothetical protein PVH60_12335, partial [Anaerolineales bacterium]